MPSSFTAAGKQPALQLPPPTLATTIATEALSNTLRPAVASSSQPRVAAASLQLPHAHSHHQQGQSPPTSADAICDVSKTPIFHFLALSYLMIHDLSTDYLYLFIHFIHDILCLCHAFAVGLFLVQWTCATPLSGCHIGLAPCPCVVLGCLWTESSSQSRDCNSFGHFGREFVPPWP